MRHSERPQPYTAWVKVNFEGETWELRTDDRNPNYEVYGAHINCIFSHIKQDAYASLWSWEKGDFIESDEGIPWCHYCHVFVPDGLLALRVLLDKGGE
jgi:hypothetical protein